MLLINNILIDKKANTPQVILNKEIGLIELSGDSYPENAFEFFKPIIEWIELYFKESTNLKTIINIKLKYFNSATTSILFNLFDIIKYANYKNYEIFWFYDAISKRGFDDYQDYSEEYPELHIKAVAF